MAQGIEAAYLQRLNDYYDAWISDSALSPVFTIKTSGIDFISHREHLDRINDVVSAVHGTGLGGDMVLGDKLRQGFRWDSGEVGHTYLYWSGKKSQRHREDRQ